MSKHTPKTSFPTPGEWAGPNSGYKAGRPAMSLLLDGTLLITLGSEVEQQFEIGECVAVCLSDDGQHIGIKKRTNGYKVRGGDGRSKYVCLGRLMNVLVNSEGRSFAVETMHDPDEHTWWFAIPDEMSIERAA